MSDILQQTGFSKSQNPPFTILGIVRFFKMILFRCNFFSVNQHSYPNLFFFKPSFFGTKRLFSNLFLSKLPRLLQKTKRFASIKDCLGFSTLCDIFRKKQFELFFQEKFFLVGEKLVSESYLLGVSKLFSEVFIKTSWAYFKNFALFEL